MLLTFKRKLFLSVKYIECTWKNKTGSISYFLLYILNEFVNRLNWIHFYGTVDVNLLAKRKLSNKHLNYIIILNYVFKYIKSINRFAWKPNAVIKAKSRNVGTKIRQKIQKIEKEKKRNVVFLFRFYLK